MTTLLTIVAALSMTACAGVKTGKLVGLHAGGGIDGLYEIDIDTGEATQLHGFDFNRSEGALAVGPDGTLYAAFSGDLDQLVIVDPETGDLTFVGPFGFNDVSGLTFAPDGTLYGFDGTSDLLITIDPLTGDGTAIGFVASVGNAGLAFTPDGILHLAGGAGGLARLYTVDLDTGAGTEVGPFAEDLNITSSLESIGDTLYADANEESTGLNWLVTVDRETGQATKVGPFNPFVTLSMGGMAFLPGAGDVDRDGDVDSDDFDIFVSCFTGADPEEELPIGCLFLDTDGDGDIDCDDWIEFINAWTEDEDPPTFDKCPPCEGDANGDGTVDPLDSGFVLARFGCPVGEGDPNCDIADQNGDNAVDPLDVGFVLARFGPCE